MVPRTAALWPPEPVFLVPVVSQATTFLAFLPMWSNGAGSSGPAGWMRGGTWGDSWE